MDPTPWEALKALFEEASRLSADERVRYLEKVHATDPEVGTQLKRLLAAGEKADSFFDDLACGVFSEPLWLDAAPHSETPDPLIGRSVHQYRIEEKLGRGGMGIVYRAHDTSLDRSVALKFLPRHLGGDEAAAERFLVEARAAAALDHPNICVVHEIGEDEDGGLFIAMALYEGETLRRKLERGRLPLEEACEYARQIAAGLRAAHAHDIIHRDIKPSNVIVTSDGVAKLLDFGLAKLTGVTLTEAGGMLGTVAYMSPEQATGGAVDDRTDLWSLGIVMYEMLTGERPFRGGSNAVLIHAIVNEAPAPLSTLCQGVPAELEAVVAQLLTKNPGERPEIVDLLGVVDRWSGLAEPGLGGPGATAGSAEPAAGGPRRQPMRIPPFIDRRARPPLERLPIGFVSRGEELETLTDLLRAALAGKGRVGFITGEAGTGKTALVEEFCRRAMRARRDLVVATGNGNAHTGTGDPHLLFREILGLLTVDIEARWTAGSISPDHATRLWNLLPATATALVDQGPDLIGSFIPVQALLDRASTDDASDSSWAVRLSQLLQSRKELPGSPPTQAALFHQYGRVLRAVARDRPLLLVLDDLQWADKGSLDLLFQLGRQLQGSRILILGLYRPSEVALGRNGDRHPLSPVISELVRTYGDVEVRLGEREDRDFVDAIVDALPNQLDREFKETLFRRTRGHALFTVELLWAMQNQGMLVWDGGHWTAGKEVDWRTLPARVDAVIAERIARLPKKLERVLTVASVEGERFTLESVAALSGSSVNELLPLVADELERRHHLVRAQGIRHLGEQTLSQYRFRHILFQKYLYDRLDPVERTHLHARTGQALERLYGDRAGEAAPALAHHFREAGLTGKAVTYSCQAGDQAKSAAAFPEAVAYFRGALELLRALPESLERDHQELPAQVGLALIWYGVEGHGLAEAERALERARKLAGRTGDRVQHFWILGSLFALCHYQARHGSGHEALSECLTLAEEEGNPGLLALCHLWLALNSYNRGHPTTALTHADRGRALYDPAQHRATLSSWMGGDPGHGMEAFRGLVLWSLGYPDQARAHIEAAASSAKETGHPGTLHLVLIYGVTLYLWLREVEALARENEALESLATEHGMPQLMAWTTVFRGWHRLQEGEFEQAAALLEDGLATLEAQGWCVWQPYYAVLLADVYRSMGYPEKALRIVDEGLATIQHTGERINEPEQHRLRGEHLLALKKPDPAEAEAAFRRAIDLARGQEAKSYELRAATSLARLLHETGRTDEARRTLADVYGWFTEGFDTQDLKDAATLLAEMKAGD